MLTGRAPLQTLVLGEVDDMDDTEVAVLALVGSEPMLAAIPCTLRSARCFVRCLLVPVADRQRRPSLIHNRRDDLCFLRVPWRYGPDDW
ncbi:hypothetical protein A5725_24575 [Mycobacterium kubicae]|nr:hypothetical protein A5725_24575 [Mycobacterium kubicae]